MRTSPATQDRGIRSIFTSAMGVEEDRRSGWERFVDAIDSRVVRSAVLGALSGAVMAVGGFGLLVITTPRDAAAETASIPDPEVRHLVAETKGDRGIVAGGKLSALATTAAFADRQVGDVTIGGTAHLLTLGEPIAYAGSASQSAIRAIDRALEPAPIVTASLGDPMITPPPLLAADGLPTAVREDDDDGDIIPVPRARPDYVGQPLALPLPRPRPAVPVAVATAPNETIVEERVPNAARTPDAVPPSQVLGFFSSPTEPVKAPSKSISIDTPFGVPYVLQQGSVETACIKPELVDLLRRIEGHYRQKVVITSGFRDRGRQGSLHRQCAAVDIEVPGVSAPALAAYARTLPDIGGVGTYCHAHMIHIDIGTPRDWKYGCGSFFAMRGAPGKWGKPPAALARASTGAAEAAAED